MSGSRVEGAGPTGLPTPFAERVLDAVAAIPAGEVRTYAQIADAMGSSAPRAVGNALARFGGGVPWWRVVHADGSLASGHETDAAAALVAEGVRLRRAGSQWRVA